MSSVTRGNCPILVGASNYPIWKIRITETLRKEKVWDVVSGLDPNPDQSTSASTQTSIPSGSSASATSLPQTSASTATVPLSSSSSRDPWHVRDGKAHGIISEHLSDHDALAYAIVATSKEMFDQITRKYEGTNIGVNAFYTFANMMGRKYDDANPIKDHISSLAADARKLTSMNKSFDDS